jgi:hypothetical protein
MLSLGVVFAGPASAGIPADKVAVVLVRAIDGLGSGDSGDRNSVVGGVAYQIDEASRDLAISRAGSGISSLDGVKTIVLVERREDTQKGGDIVQKHSHSVLTSGGSSFSVDAIGGGTLSYDVVVFGRKLVVTGPGDRITVTGGKPDSYQVWRVSPLGLFDRDRVELY